MENSNTQNITNVNNTVSNSMIKEQNISSKDDFYIRY